MGKNLKYPKSEYTLLGYEKAKAKGKKYTAIIQNKTTGRKKKINFGAIRKDGTPYPQYKDKVLGMYSKYDHNDKARRERYRKRHANTFSPNHYSSSYFSMVRLWS